MNITIGILVSYWLEYGTHYIGGTVCAPGIPYTGGTASDPTFNPYTDVGPNGCTGQSDASWRVPFALQIVPGLVLGIGMLFFPESPRYLLMKQKDEQALSALSRIRRVHLDTESLRIEFLAIKAEVLFEESYAHDHWPGQKGIRLALSQYRDLVSSRPAFHRLAVGCCTMFFQQFMGCNAMIYYGKLFTCVSRKILTKSYSTDDFRPTWSVRKHYLSSCDRCLRHCQYSFYLTSSVLDRQGW